jgi:lysophospholipid acyltransferase (LPLAT)-like uncharacterized protein
LSWGVAQGPRESEARIARRRRDGRIIATVLKAIGLTLRCELRDPFGVFDSLPHPHIYALWHNRLACSPIWYRRLMPPTQRHMGLISPSGDGEILAAVMGAFGIDAARGSSSRGGTEAIVKLLHALEQGSDVTVTPDGPRGPCHRAQPGVVHLARLSGRPIIPARIELGWKVELRTWDRFQVPLPFSRCVLRVGQPIDVAVDADEAEIVRRLEEAMTTC